MPSKQGHLFLGIDFGTSGCRAAVINSQGELITLCTMDLPAPVVDGCQISQSPDIWRDGLLRLLCKLGEGLSLRDIAAISIDGTSGSVLLCDDNGTALTDALLYNDASSKEEAARIKTLAPAESGAHGVTSGLAKLAHLYNKQYDHSRTDCRIRATTQASWLTGLCTGDFSFIDENNALKMGYDVINAYWPRWLEQIIDTRQIEFPRVVPPGTVIGKVSADFAKTTGLCSETQIVSGTTDSIAAFIATGIDQIGEAVTTLGSTLVIKLLSDKPIFEPQYGVYSHKLGDKWLVGGASNAGCAILKHFFTQQQLDQMTPLLDPLYATGLDYYPLPQKGERFPFANSELEPRLEPRPNDDVKFFQGLLEGLTNIELLAYKKLHDLGAPYPTRILTSGGGSKNPAWIKMRARTLNTDVAAAYQTQAAYGSALLAKKGFETGNQYV